MNRNLMFAPSFDAIILQYDLDDLFETLTSIEVSQR